MTFRKFFRAAMIAAAVAVGLSACGGTTDATDSASTESGSTVIVIGGSGPLTGGQAQYGIAVQRSAQIAVDEINAKGGQQYELIFEDDEADSAKSPIAYSTLVDNGMQVSLYCVTTGAAAAVAQNYADDQIFAITPSASSLTVLYADADNLTGAFGNTFQMCFTDPSQGAMSAQYFLDHSLGSKYAVIYKSDDQYSSGIYATFAERAEEIGLDVVYVGTFVEGDTDFNVQLQQAQNAGADVVYLPIYYDPAALILTQADAMGYDPIFFGNDGMDGILAVDGFDTSLAEGLYMTTPFAADASDELTVNFVTTYESLYGETPNQFGADAYDCVYAIAQAVENAGVTGDMTAEEICVKLVEQFTSMEFSGLTGSGMTWAATGEVSKDVSAVIIQNGTYVSAE